MPRAGQKSGTARKQVAQCQSMVPNCKSQFEAYLTLHHAARKGGVVGLMLFALVQAHKDGSL
jgi:hypothetical protein